jgi:alkaline phosphatase D
VNSDVPTAVVWLSRKTPGPDQDRSPAAGLQFFGHIAIDGKTERMTVTLRDVNDAALWSTVIEPRPA